MFTNYPKIRTINFGDVIIRRTHTEGKPLTILDLSNPTPKEAFAEIRQDWRTNQPFAVILDGDLKELRRAQK